MPNYRYIGAHADQLASGRHIAPGDEVPASAVEDDDPLLAGGLLIEIPKRRVARRRKATKEETTK